MDTFHGLPPWIRNSKKSLKQTQEWQTFMMKLYDMVHHQMQEMGIGSFDDLAPPERQLLLQRGFHALKTSEIFFQLLETTSESLDESVSQEADKLSRISNQNKTKIEILQEECHKGVSSLLQKWPDSRTSLRQCLNANIPFELRYVMWKNFLKNPKARENYLKIVDSDPRKLVSRLDFEISQKCQSLLEADHTLKQIPNRKATHSLMRHILSYRHLKMNPRGGLMEADYLLCIPPIVCTLTAFHSPTTPSTPQKLTTEAMATLEEQFSAFMDKRPDYMMTQGASLEDLTAKTGALLQKIDPQLGLAIENLKVAQQQVAKAKSGVSRLQTILTFLLHSLVRSMFVGYLPMESVFHVWDLIVMGFDQPRYDPVPHICAAILALLHSDLVKCQTEKEAATAIVKGCRNIHQDRLRLTIAELGFEKQLKENLNVAEEFPVFHPAIKSNLPPWKHWYSGKLISHIQDERNETRPKAILLAEDPASPGSSHSTNARDEQLWQLERRKVELEVDVEKLKEENDVLLAEIQAERRLRIDLQENADEEIERLRRQLNVQRRNGKEIEEEVTKPKVIAVPGPPPPTAEPPTSQDPEPTATTPEEELPPTPVEQEPQPEPEKTPIPQPEPPEEPILTDKGEEAMKATNDILKRMMDAISLLAHGRGKTRKELDQMTRKDVQKFTAAMSKAQVSVFGRPVTDEDIQRIPTPERKQKISKLQEETVKKLFHIK